MRVVYYLWLTSSSQIDVMLTTEPKYWKLSLVHFETHVLSIVKVSELTSLKFVWIKEEGHCCVEEALVIMCDRYTRGSYEGVLLDNCYELYGQCLCHKIYEFMCLENSLIGPLRGLKYLLSDMPQKWLCGDSSFPRGQRHYYTPFNAAPES